MSVTPTSSTALAIAGTIELIANSATFQNRIADYHDDMTATEADALLHIYSFDVYKPGVDLSSLRPFAMVGLADANWNRLVQCSAVQYLPSGTIVVVLEDNARFTECFGDDPDDSYGDSFIDALNFFGGVVDDWSGLAGGSDYTFPPSSIRTIEPAFRPDINSRQTDDCWTTILAIEWGTQPTGGAE